MCLVIGNEANRSKIARHMIGFADELGPNDRAVAGSGFETILTFWPW